MPNKSKFTPEQLADFARAREEIASIAKTYEGKKAQQNDRKMIAAKTIWNNPEYKQKRIEQNKELVNSPEWKESLKKAVTTDEFRKKKSNTSKACWQDPEYVKVQSKAHKAAVLTDEYRKKLSDAQQRVNQDPIKLKRKQDAVRASTQTKEWRDNQRKAKEEFRNDPVRYQAFLKKLKASRPAVAEKCSKPVKGPDGVWPSFTQCYKDLGIAIGTLQTRMKNHPDKWFYISKEEYQHLTLKK